MFVSIHCDLGSDDHRKSVYSIISQYGCKQIMKDVFESTSLEENTLSRLKRDIDKKTDFYDTIRIYQYPINDAFVISYLNKKKWRRFVVRQ